MGRGGGRAARRGVLRTRRRAGRKEGRRFALKPEYRDSEGRDEAEIKAHIREKKAAVVAGGPAGGAGPSEAGPPGPPPSTVFPLYGSFLLLPLPVFTRPRWPRPRALSSAVPGGGAGGRSAGRTPAPPAGRGRSRRPGRR